MSMALDFKLDELVIGENRLDFINSLLHALCLVSNYLTVLLSLATSTSNLFICKPDKIT